MPAARTPSLHQLHVQVAAPSQLLSARNGDIRAADGVVEGMVHADVRVLHTLLLRVDGEPLEHLATSADDQTTVITALAHLDAGPIRVDRHRTLAPGQLTERIRLASRLDEAVRVAVELTVRGDSTDLLEVRSGAGGAARESVLSVIAERAVIDGSELVWQLEVPARGEVEVSWSARPEGIEGPVVAPPPATLDIESVIAELASADPRLEPWLRRSLTDLAGLRAASAASPDQPFSTAGAPWFLTLFGRDSIWTARFLLPWDVAGAAGTLRSLAAHQGRRTDPATAEQPGKIPHEIRGKELHFSDMTLPPVYWGTIDATALWILLLAEAVEAGLELAEDLRTALRGAAGWLLDHSDADGDGFVEYIDTSGHGLANQGWKDSGDSVRFADGSLATAPIALVEVQGYCHAAALAAADLLADEPDLAERLTGWAADLKARFAADFWCGEGADRFPALAIDGEGRRVDSPTSNIGHLLGTGILEPAEEEVVAARLARPDLDSGLGLRTMADSVVGYDPLSYHCGSVWPHDTAIVIDAMLRSGQIAHATGLVEGLVRASDAFDGQLPELWSGEGRAVPYPSACHPQAWSAASALVVARARQAAS